MFSRKGENLIGGDSDSGGRAYSSPCATPFVLSLKKEFSNFPHARVSDLNAATRATLAQMNPISVCVFTALRSEMHRGKALVSGLQALFSAAHLQFRDVWHPHWLAVASCDLTTTCLSGRLLISSKTAN